MLNGYLTYIAGVGFIVVGIYQIIIGDTQKGVESIVAGFAVIGGRRAIGKIIDSNCA